MDLVEASFPRDGEAGVFIITLLFVGIPARLGTSSNITRIILVFESVANRNELVEIPVVFHRLSIVARNETLATFLTLNVVGNDVGIYLVFGYRWSLFSSSMSYQMD
jgi:hypothetical protein